MTHKTTAFKFVVSTTIAIALGIIAWSGAGQHFAAIDQAGAKHGASPEIAELPNPALARVRLLVSNLN